VESGWLVGWVDGWVDGCDGWMDGWVGGWMDGWMDERQHPLCARAAAAALMSRWVFVDLILPNVWKTPHRPRGQATKARKELKEAQDDLKKAKAKLANQEHSIESQVRAPAACCFTSTGPQRTVTTVRSILGWLVVVDCIGMHAPHALIALIASHFPLPIDLSSPSSSSHAPVTQVGDITRELENAEAELARTREALKVCSFCVVVGDPVGGVMMVRDGLWLGPARPVMSCRRLTPPLSLSLSMSTRGTHSGRRRSGTRRGRR
jgi:hypothetical protein